MVSGALDELDRDQAREAGYEDEVERAAKDGGDELRQCLDGKHREWWQKCDCQREADDLERRRAPDREEFGVLREEVEERLRQRER